MAVIVGDVVEANGKTVRQNNLAVVHDIPLGALVEVTCSGLRLYVVAHSRDCDGSCLYDLSFDIDVINDLAELEANAAYYGMSEMMLLQAQTHSKIDRHYGRESLVVIRLPGVVDGAEER